MGNPFSIGGVYFRVKYADAARRYPLIDSFVFLGKNLSAEDLEDTWYFQFADSFAKYGSVLKEAAGDRRVSCLTERELEDMIDLDSLFLELKNAQQRRKSGTGSS